MTEILTIEQLENIKNHRYESCGYTSFDNFLNEYIWVPVSNRIPPVNKL